MSTSTGLRGSDVAERVGITYRQLDYWIRLGYLGKHHRDLGSGKARNFTEADITALRVVRALYSLDSRIGLLRDLVPMALAHVRTGHRGLLTLGGGLYLDLGEVVGEP